MALEHMETWLAGLKVGDVVCDCDHKHQRITEIRVEVDGRKHVLLEDGTWHIATSCLDPVDTHSVESHPDYRDDGGEG